MKARPKRKTDKRKKKRLGFGFFLIVMLMLAGTGVFIVSQHQMATSSELKSREIDEEIAEERATQKSLRVKLARLESPARVARIAIDALEMSDPDAVIYLRYTIDEEGNLACQSSYESWSGAAAWDYGEEEEETEPEPEEEPSKALTQR